MSARDDAESWNEDIQALEAEVERLSARQKDCESRIRRLLFEEDPGSGKHFAGEIHALQQERLKLEVEIDILRKRRNRILLALKDPGLGPPSRTS